MSRDNNIPDLTKEQFLKFANFVHEQSSITLKEHKLLLLSNRLRRRLYDLKISSYDHYYDYLQAPTNAVEMIHFLDAITTNETYFWRTTQNFDLLKKRVVPDLIKNFDRNSLAFWSAGCSSGEEPYNLAMELTETMKVTGIFNFKIRASDLSEQVVNFARTGAYKGRKIDQVPPAMLRRYFRQSDITSDEFIVRDDIKSRVDFYVENLFKSKLDRFHCIFCRNVMIYFNRDDQLTLINRFYEALQPGGYLMIGHSESLHMFDTQFKNMQFEEGIVYKKS